jgi:hypothetical protein
MSDVPSRPKTGSGGYSRWVFCTMRDGRE